MRLKQAVGSLLWSGWEALSYRVAGRHGSCCCILDLVGCFLSGQALKPEAASFIQSFMDGIKKFYVTRVKGFDPYKICVATLVFEGTPDEVAAQEKRVYEIASNFGYLCV